MVLSVRSPDSLRRKYSPCSLRFVTVASPRGAHLTITSAIQSELRPLNAPLTGLPAASRSSKPRSLAEARRYDRPVCHAVDSPTSPPRWPYIAHMPAPLRFVSLP